MTYHEQHSFLCSLPKSTVSLSAPDLHMHSVMYRGSLLRVDKFHRTLFEHGIQQILIKKKKKTGHFDGSSAADEGLRLGLGLGVRG